MGYTAESREREAYKILVVVRAYKKMAKFLW